MKITRDIVDYVQLSQADAHANDSTTIASKISVTLSQAAHMSLSELIGAAEQAETQLEACFARGNRPGMMSQKLVMDDLILRIVASPVPQVDLAVRRVQLLAKHWKLYRESRHPSVLLAIIGAALLADCAAHNISVSWVDPVGTTLH